MESQYARSLIEASLDPLMTISPEGKVTDMNHATINSTGLTREELTGTDFFNYFTEPQKAREVYQEVFAKGSVADSPLTLRHKDGKLTDVLFNGSIYKDQKGKVLGVVIVARDVTHQKMIENQLNEAKNAAEEATKIAEEATRTAEQATKTAEEATRAAEDAAKTAEDATKTAEEAVKAKQQFLSNMSHEIRTPMSAIIGFTKVVLKTELTEKQEEYLNAIKMSGDALIVLINDILDLAKIDSGKMTFEQIPFNLSKSIAAMLHVFETKIQEKNLKLVKEYDPQIPDILVGDPVRLHQIVLNLMSNAVKFTASGKITVSVMLVHQDAENATINFAVSDTGIGIKDNKKETIFDNFQQATSGTSRLYGGTGLGLAIVKQLVESQGGTISVQSKLGEGSTFSFLLTFKKTAGSAEFQEEVEELDSEIKGLKILVVEDIPLNQLLMKTVLDDFGFDCVIADNGLIAIEKLKSNTFDVILMDLLMPVMNGFEATTYIRDVLHSKVPIIALTADVTTVDLAKCRSVGMNDYIAKPLDEKLLYRKIISQVNETFHTQVEKVTNCAATQKSKCINLNYLNLRTKSNPALMMQMISLYLQQTPPLVSAMKKGLKDKDWNSLYTAAHKIIPSFAIMGISTDFENMAKKVQEFANTQKQEDDIPKLVSQIETVCLQACEELEQEIIAIKKTN